jgi:hypothetical protein
MVARCHLALIIRSTEASRFTSMEVSVLIAHEVRFVKS